MKINKLAFVIHIEMTTENLNTFYCMELPYDSENM